MAIFDAFCRFLLLLIILPGKHAKLQVIKQKLGFYFTFLLPVASALNSNEQQSILDCHNAFRSKLAKGAANSRNGLMPTGSNIVQLQYDTGIEAIAQSWANQCTMAHSSSAQRRGTGENLFMSTASNIAKSESKMAFLMIKLVAFSISAAASLQ